MFWAYDQKSIAEQYVLYSRLMKYWKSKFKDDIFVKVRSTGKLLKSKVEINNTSANVNLFENEYGISPGQACVFYKKNNNGYKVLGGGWIKS